MLEVDFHSHSFFSNCGIHTHIELLTRAKELGLKGLAITDHGPALNSRITPPFFDRLKNPINGIKLLKGMECNIVDNSGTIDLPLRYCKFLDLVLLGLHPNIARGQSRETYTEMMLTALEKNPWVDIVTHPDEKDYPLDYQTVAVHAKKYGIALELNNSKLLHDRTSPAEMTKLITACKVTGCSVALGSDAHALEEIGLDDAIRPFLTQLKFPDDLLVNNTAEKAFAFIEARRGNKTS